MISFYVGFAAFWSSECSDVINFGLETEMMTSFPECLYGVVGKLLLT